MQFWMLHPTTIKEEMMLVLTRKRGESIQIGGEVQVQVLSVQGNRVRLGITAPSSVGVRRGELVFDLDSNTEELTLEPESSLDQELVVS